MSSLSFRPAIFNKNQGSCQRRLVSAQSTWKSKGPYEPRSQIIQVQEPLDNGEIKTATLTAHYPVEKDSITLTKLKCPLILFTSGFKMISTFYEPYALHLASWGYVVLQYDFYDWTKNFFTLFQFLDDKTLLNCYGDFTKDLEKVVSRLDLPFEVETNEIGVAGHSRGGKISTLLAIDKEYKPRVKAMFLIDPVDDVLTLNTERYPSAVNDLKHRPTKMGLAGSSVCGLCNPGIANFEKFFAQAKEDSWLATIPQAGHMQFLKAPTWIQFALNLLCFKGSTTNEVVMPITAAFLVAWFEIHLRHPKPEHFHRRKTEFFEWVKKQEESGTFSFKQK